MTTSSPHNDRIPTDPTTWAVLLLTAAAAISQLDPGQTQALIATGGIAELALIALRSPRGRR